MDHNQLRDYIQNFSLDNCPLGNQGYKQVLLQLFGFTGHGKSALINSLKCVLHCTKFIMHANSGVLCSGGAVTMERRAYTLTPTITVMDNRGFGQMNNLEKRMIYAQLGNFLPLNKRVEWESSYEDFVYQLEDSELDPNYTDFIVPVFVYKMQVMLPQQKITQMKAFIKNCRALTGVFPIVVLTYKTSGDYSEFEKVFRCLGAEVVVAVENYSEEDQLKTLGRSKDFLTLLKSALDSVTFRMQRQRNSKGERIERKKFLFRYVHDIDMAQKIKEQAMKQEARKKEEARKREEAIKREEARERGETRRKEEAREREETRRKEEAREREEARRREEARERENSLLREAAIKFVEAFQREVTRRREEARERENSLLKEAAIKFMEAWQREEARRTMEREFATFRYNVPFQNYSFLNINTNIFLPVTGFNGHINLAVLESVYKMLTGQWNLY